MTDPNYRIEWADGSATEVAFRLLPLVQLEIEEDHGAPFAELAAGPKGTRVLAEAIWRFFQLRLGETREFAAWFGEVDDIIPIGAMAEAINAVTAAQREREAEPPPFEVTGSSSGSSGSQPTPVNPFLI